ncbi:MAG: AAA family ATPase [Actinobacteria bacterium]|nr:AAA family ATPase [Actinomycetota bacterium]
MRIRRVIAPAFGPLVDASLELAPGMNVLHGPNEAGKSSWHAALFTGICGLQRGAARRNEKRWFTDAHKPWDRDGWVVGAEIELADGRIVELRHDLDGSVDCTAKDVTLGRDYANEIMFEGSPDGSVWLGLNRRSFPVTACVRQAELLSVVEDPDLLQEHLQRAAATGGTDSTAAKALSTIEAYLRDHVGLDRANSTKPLRRAIERLRAAENGLDEATYEHEAYIELLARAEALDRSATEAANLLRVVEAAWALEKARRWEKRLDKARQLASLYPTAPPSPVEDDSLAREVAGALEAWESAPDGGELIGPSPAELQAQIDALPEMPDGDLEPDPRVVRARDEVVLAGREIERVAAQEPAAPEAGSPPLPSARTRSRVAAPMVSAALLIGTGGIALSAGAIAVGSVLLALGAVALGLGLWRTFGPASIRTPAEERDRIERARRARSFWETEMARLRAEEVRLRAAAESSLGDKDVEVGADIVATVGRYEIACRKRSAQAAEARQREPLVRQLEVQRRAELAVRADAQRRADALAKLTAVAARCGIGGGTAEPDELVARLRRWEVDRADALTARAAAWEEFGHLRRLLDGMTLEELEQQVGDRSRAAAELAAGLDPYELGTVELRSDVKDQIALLRATAADHRRRGDTARGEADQARKSLPSVAEAEEEVAAARTELERVRRLLAILEATREFLEEAQDSVHRDIAPQLAASVREWLPAITEGRYTDVRVDPENLYVEVLDRRGVWRDAILLSHGTKEQIYLLLRVGLAEHLTKPGEIAPLILDDVTVQFDSRRKEAVLAMLHRLSARHQIILFTQEDEVWRWAAANLAEPGDRLTRLEEAGRPNAA